MVIRSARLLRKKVRPRFLRVVQNERDKLHERLLRGVPRGIRPGDGGWLRSDGAASAEQSKEVCLEDEAENQQKDGAADADMHAAESKTASATAGIVASILDILALTAWRPSHNLFLFLAGKRNVNWSSRLAPIITDVITGFANNHERHIRAGLQACAFAMGAMASRIFQVRSLSTIGKSNSRRSARFHNGGRES
jgi:hypothetical protein